MFGSHSMPKNMWRGCIFVYIGPLFKPLVTEGPPFYLSLLLSPYDPHFFKNKALIEWPHLLMAKIEIGVCFCTKIEIESLITGCPRKIVQRKSALVWCKLKFLANKTYINVTKWKSWLLNAVYFSQFGCCNPEISRFFQTRALFRCTIFSRTPCNFFLPMPCAAKPCEKYIDSGQSDLA